MRRVSTDERGLPDQMIVESEDDSFCREYGGDSGKAQTFVSAAISGLGESVKLQEKLR